MTMPVSDLVEEGRRALRCGDAVAARRAFEQAAGAGTGASGDLAEGLARVAYLELDFPRAIEG